ncbi:MAG: chemotaxis protein CheW [Coleofasciculaceae cyanobacterium SM2_1_6]|nr:chemotaxis protein CheW [Coleofasciculaceae cyanobacterium SM2_1_6]
MLLLLFHVGQERYALESERVVQVFPNLLLKEIRHAPDYISGLFNYQGQIIPVLDLSHLIQGKACPNLLSTRIILVKSQVNSTNSTKSIAQDTQETQNNLVTDPKQINSPALHLLGLRAERVTTTLDVSPHDLKEKVIRVDAAPYLGKIITDDQGMIQLIRIEHLLSGVSSIALLAATE